MKRPQFSLEHLEQQLYSISSKIYSFAREKPAQAIGAGIVFAGVPVAILSNLSYHATHIENLHTLSEITFAGAVLGGIIYTTSLFKDLRRMIRGL